MSPIMPTMRGWAGPVALSAGAAFALWLSFGALAVSEPSVDARIGLLPPLWQLGLLLALGVTLAVAAVRHRVRLAPLAAFIFLVLPWLPLPLPASALVWTGPMARVLLLLVASSMAALWFEEHRGAGSRVGLLAVWSHPHRAPALAAILAFSLYLAAAWQMREVRPNGDEPHYLVITQSLLKDGDLQIQNNHHQDDYLAYWTTLLAPDYLRRGTNGAIYSVHAPGLAVLVAPAFALAGYGGVVVFLTLIAALASALAWRVGWLVSGSASAAWFAWAAVALSPPYFFLAGAIYPDGPAAACSLVVVCVLLTAERALSRGEPSHLPGRTMCLVGGVALAFLPWLHTRYAATAALLGMIAAWRLSCACRPRSGDRPARSRRRQRCGMVHVFLRHLRNAQSVSAVRHRARGWRRVDGHRRPWVAVRSAVRPPVLRSGSRWSRCRMGTARAHSGIPVQCHRGAGRRRAEATLTRISIAGVTRRGRIGLPDTYFALPQLTAGTYWLRTQHPAPFDLDVSVGRPAGARGHRPFDSLHLAAGGDPPAALTLPVDAYDVRIIGDDRAQALGELTLEPVRLNRDRASFGTAHRAARYPEAVVFFLDRAVYPDRDAFWVRGSATTQFVVKPSNSSAPVSLLLRNGPVANQVTIHGDGWHQSFSMNAGEEQLVTARATTRDAIRFEVSSQATFVPRIVDRSSADVRRLGVWVAIR